MARDGLLAHLEAESIHILREVAAQAAKPCILYSVGKDSSVVVHLARKAFYPDRFPFPLVHVDTGFEFPELYEFRDWFVGQIGAELIVHRNEAALAKGTNPYDLGTQACCGLLRTQALVQGLREHGFDAAIGGARRDEEKARAKERIFSFRDKFGQWDPRAQRPELWSLYNGKVRPGESMRVFPISNWTEADVWRYIMEEEIPIVPLYYAKKRRAVMRSGSVIPIYKESELLPGERAEEMMCRFRTLGCTPCTGAILSEADTLPKIFDEMMATRISERANRIIDHDAEGSMEMKKREGYF